MLKPKVEVHLWAGIRAFAEGQERVTVEARNVGEMLTALAQTYPGMADIIEEGVSVSINGLLFADDLTPKLEEGQEIFLLQKLRGG